MQQIHSSSLPVVIGICDPNQSQARHHRTMLKLILCSYSDAYILVKGRITITGAGANAAERQADKRIIFEKLCFIY